MKLGESLRSLTSNKITRFPPAAEYLAHCDWLIFDFPRFSPSKARDSAFYRISLPPDNCDPLLPTVKQKRQSSFAFGSDDKPDRLLVLPSFHLPPCRDILITPIEGPPIATRAVVQYHSPAAPVVVPTSLVLSSNPHRLPRLDLRSAPVVRSRASVMRFVTIHPLGCPQPAEYASRYFEKQGC